jgi:hypothetical protein
MKQIKTTLLVTAILLWAAVASAAFIDSFEGNADAWYPLALNGALTVQTVGDGAPAVSITDGSYSVMATHEDESRLAELMRIDQATSSDWWAAIKDPANNLMTIDVFVPGEAMVAANWANITIVFSGFNFSISEQVDLVKQVDNQVTVSLDYSSIDDAVLAAAGWGGATININASTGTRSPVYLDNYQVIPEPATIGMLGLGGLLTLLVRRITSA